MVRVRPSSCGQGPPYGASPWPFDEGLIERGPPGCLPEGRVQAPELEEPVITSLTDEQWAELSRKNDAQNQRSEDSARAKDTH